MSMIVKIKPLVLVGASGSGRMALMFHLLSTLPQKFQRAIPHTSRPPRQTELNGLNFHFASEQQILEMYNNSQFITLLKSIHGHYYGLTRQQLQTVLNHRKIPIFRLTLSAYMQQVANKKLDCHAIYIKVRNLKELQQRLKFGPFSKEEVEEKMQNARQEQQKYEQIFEEENVVQNGLEEQEESFIRLKARLFQLY